MNAPMQSIAPVRRVFFAPTLALSILVPSVMLPHSPLVSATAAATAAGLALLRARLWLVVAATALALWALYRLTTGFDPYIWLGALVFALAAIAPRSLRMFVPNLSLDAWGAIIAIGTLAMAVAIVMPGLPGFAAGFVATACTALIAAAVAQRLIQFNGLALTDNMNPTLALLTRDLLLGRITSGLLHDLSQPLNIISMANGNLDYIIERLDINDEQRGQLVERTRRIASNTHRAAQVLGLFRWFGRDGSRDRGLLTIGSALDRAVAVVKADLNLGDIGIDVRGNALDYPVLLRHGTVEMLVVAALLGTCRALAGADGRPASGSVTIDAEQHDHDILVTIRCRSSDDTPCIGEVDAATMWLVTQIAREGAGDFRRVGNHDQPLCFVIRLARDVI